MRCVDCGRPPHEACCEVCHRVARAVKRLAEAMGYTETARELTEVINTEVVNQ